MEDLQVWKEEWAHSSCPWSCRGLPGTLRSQDHTGCCVHYTDREHRFLELVQEFGHLSQNATGKILVHMSRRKKKKAIRTATVTPLLHPYWRSPVVLKMTLIHAPSCVYVNLGSTTYIMLLGPSVLSCRQTLSRQILAEEKLSFASYAFCLRRHESVFLLRGLFLTNIVIWTNKTTPVSSTAKSILLCAWWIIGKMSNETQQSKIIKIS